MLKIIMKDDVIRFVASPDFLEKNGYEYIESLNCFMNDDEYYMWFENNDDEFFSTVACFDMPI